MALCAFKKPVFSNRVPVRAFLTAFAVYSFFAFFNVCNFQGNLEAASLSVVEIDNKKYVDLNQFLSVDSQLTGNVDHLTLVVEIRYRQKIVRIKIGQPYYVSGGEKYTLEYPPIVAGGAIYIPLGLGEELLSELHIPVKYKYQNTQAEFVAVEKREPRLQLDFIVLDPGHGGKDPGALGVGSLQEKDITLAVARYVFHYLQKALPNTKIYITRYNDKFISLSERVEIANKKLENHSFGLFISLHCNATLHKKIHGFEIFYLAQNPDSEEARRVMLAENIKESESASEAVSAIESLLFDSQLMAESKVLARALNQTFMTHLNGVVSGRGVKRADFAVLRGALMPAVLIEMGYISNNKEAAILRTKDYRLYLGKAIAEAVVKFMDNLPKL